MARDLVSPLRRLGSAGPSTLVATLVDLGDRGLAGSFRRSTAFRVPWYQHGSSTRDSRLMAASGTSDLAASNPASLRDGDQAGADQRRLVWRQ
jgi:hypothetical protein